MQKALMTVLVAGLAFLTACTVQLFSGTRSTRRKERSSSRFAQIIRASSKMTRIVLTQSSQC